MRKFIAWFSREDAKIKESAKFSLRLRQDLHLCVKFLCVLHGLNQSSQRVFRIAVEHACHRFKKQRVLETGETFALATLQNHD
jgi:hypothetical protein